MTKSRRKVRLSFGTLGKWCAEVCRPGLVFGASTNFAVPKGVGRALAFCRQGGVNRLLGSVVWTGIPAIAATVFALSVPLC
ncbi:unnamed protein product [Protopolystoma xenopodis]|uniref:Uncharacterized protein n=1 Tax=Protopolystoma xenopodis TaxID=117903 RepID=A0A448X3H1_9PLAT|nr:unnamed protein product [Protopolystoma xenopodis]